MDAYRRVLVGTDGSETSLRAVDRAAGMAAATGATLIIATGYIGHEDDLRAADVLGDEGYMVRGKAPFYGILRSTAFCATRTPGPAPLGRPMSRNGPSRARRSRRW
jgi:nucleotide-binding universal stress UspA family protein